MAWRPASPPDDQMTKHKQIEKVLGRLSCIENKSYIYIYIHDQGFWGTCCMLVPRISPWGIRGYFSSIQESLAWINVSRSLLGPSGIGKTGLGYQKNHPRSIFIDFTNMFESVSAYFTWLHDFLFISMLSRVWKRPERYLKSLCLRMLAWALFWTCLVKETMFFKYWRLPALRRATSK